MVSTSRWVVVFGIWGVLSTMSVQAAAGLEEAVLQGQAHTASRLRYEHAEQDVPGRRQGQALTARLRLAYQTAAWRDLSALAEFEGVWSLTDADDYNSLRNGAVGRAVIADPQGEELNRLWLRYTGIPDTEFKLGRQRIVFDNARFVGNVGWRQNEQTFRALSVVNGSLPDTRLSYAFLTHAENILFRSRPVDGHLLNLQYAGLGKALQLGAYAYLLDFSAAAADSQTVGLRASGQLDRYSYTLELANQSAYQDSDGAAVEPDAGYSLVEFGVALAPVQLRLGWEVLQGDNNSATAPFMTPLATLHKFQGWADVFLVTPEAGIQDLYAQLGAELAGVKWLAVYHRFSPDAGGPDYGAEWDLRASKVFSKRLSALVKYADYQAEAFGVNTQRLWIEVDYAF